MEDNETMAQDLSTRARAALGWTIAAKHVMPGLDVALDLSLTTNETGKVDFELVDGYQAMTQDLRIAMTTAFNSDPLNPDFGFMGIQAMAQESDRFLMRERIRIAVIHVLRADPRVGKIIDIELGDESDPAHLPTGLLSVTARFETIVGKTVEMKLGEVIFSG